MQNQVLTKKKKKKLAIWIITEYATEEHEKNRVICENFAISKCYSMIAAGTHLDKQGIRTIPAPNYMYN